ncbi:MAG TPA: hypothetical protein VJZ03_06845 [Candidatus Bathyarchaeia archaeon]|nr:hypothetical protein [Candidatus Bathyarchaeia archaeon]
MCLSIPGKIVDVKEGFARVDDPHLKSLITMLAMDEEQHYAMLRYVLENFVEHKEVITV